MKRELPTTKIASSLVRILGTRVVGPNAPSSEVHRSNELMGSRNVHTSILVFNVFNSAYIFSHLSI